MNLKLSLDQSLLVRGVAIILLMAHHYSGMGYSWAGLSVLKGFGPAICCAFFFCSGYGLSVSGRRYSAGDWTSRLCKVFLPFILANAIYILYWTNFRKYNPTPLHILSDLSGVTLINKHCWFLQSLILMYLSYALTSGRSLRILISSTILTGILYSVLSDNPASASWMGFPLGIIAARRDIRIPKACLIGACVAFPVTFYIFTFIGERRITDILYFMNFAAMVVCSIPIWFLISRIPINEFLPRLGQNLTFMGRRSMDFYMMHGLCLLILSKMRTHDQLKLLPAYIGLIILTTLLFRLIVTPILQLTTRRIARRPTA